MHRTVIERIGVYHYRRTVSSPPRRRSIINRVFRETARQGMDLQPAKGFRETGRHFIREARNDDFEPIRFGPLHGYDS